MAKPSTTEATKPRGTTPDAERITTKDRWTILTLLTMGHVPQCVEPFVTEDGFKILIFHFPQTSQDLHDRYSRGEVIPVADIREVERA